MKKMFLIAGLSLAALGAHATDVGVSISVGQPGFYGRIDIGPQYQPQLIYPQPVIIQRAPVAYAPVYLRVPPGHEKNWGKHCARYDACGRPVYFVRDNWYREVYAPGYQREHGGGGGDRRDNWRDDRRDERRDNDRGPGHGRGNGHGHGRGHDKD